VTEADSRLLAVVELDFRAVLVGYNVPRKDAIALGRELKEQVEQYFRKAKRPVRLVKFRSSDGLGTGTPHGSGSHLRVSRARH
jgi:hypothetical protein